MMLVAACAIAILIGSFAFLAYQRNAGVTLSGVSSQTANQYLSSSLALSDAATDVTVYVDFGAAESEFAISEDAFLSWCDSRGWSPDPVATPTTYFDPMWLPSDTRVVNRGYTFTLPDGRGVFDADRSRACFWTSAFP